jgi:hypothetical protein
MKPCTLLLLALVAPAAAFAITPGSSSTLTLALTASIESGGFKVVTDGETTYEYEKSTSKENAAGDVISETSEYKSVITPYRYGNAQILADLNRDNLLDGGVAGWSIVNIAFASDDESGDDSDTGPAIYAVKKGKSPVAIEFTTGELASAETSSSKYTINYLTDPAKETYVASGSGKATVTLAIADFNVQGVLTGTYRFVSGSLGKGEDAVSYETFLDGAQKVAAFSGTYLESNVAEGTLSLAAAKIVDLEPLGFATDVGDSVTAGVTSN